MPSRIRSLSNYLLMFIVVVLCIETGARLLYSWQWGESYADHSHLSVESPAYSPERSGVDFIAHQMVHPYLGFVQDNQSLPALRVRQPEPQDERAAFRVALLGGSVAQQLRHEIAAEVQVRLDRRGLDRVVILEPLAAAGAKQPQQLMHLALAFAVGKRYDVIINVDGYNEAVLPIKDNFDRGVSPVYPRLWDKYIEGHGRSDLAEIHARISIRQAQLRGLAQWCSSSIVARSAVVGNVVALIERGVMQKISSDMELLASLPPDASAQSRGVFHGSEVEAIDLATTIWWRSSKAMESLASDHGSRYFHFLQPNQYLPNTKLFETEELRVALDPEGEPSRRRELVRRVYPQFMETARNSPLERGTFRDLTGIFAENAAPLYKDRCCHFNNDGLRLLASAMADAIEQSW